MILVFILGLSLAVVMAAVGAQVATDVVHEKIAQRQPRGRQHWVNHRQPGRHRYIH